MLRRIHIAEGEKIQLELSRQEHHTLLQTTLLPVEYEDLLRRTPAGEPLQMTLEDLDDLAGYVAAEANHAKNPAKQLCLDEVCARITELLEVYTNQPVTPEDHAADLTRGVLTLMALAESHGLRVDERYGKLSLSPHHRILLLNLLEDLPAVRKVVGFSGDASPLTLSCKQIAEMCVSLARLLPRSSAFLREMIDELAVVAFTALTKALIQEDDAVGSALAPGRGRQVRVRLTQAQRRVLAELCPKLSSRLVLDQPHDRMVDLSFTEISAVDQRVGQALREQPGLGRQRVLDRIASKIANLQTAK